MAMSGAKPIPEGRQVGVGDVLDIAAPGIEALDLAGVGAFDQPTYVTSEPDSPDRLYVAERLGTIRLVQGASVGTFADLTSLVGCPPSGCAGERGLMSIAFAPDSTTLRT